ncbi:MAG: glycerophosphodiester phosphodiesterase, partial [Acidimicrobiia bacterium]
TSLIDVARTPLGPGTLVYAHRGDRSRAPDNTIEAYVLAVEAGADGIELDVRRTRDGVLIVHHDDRDPAIGILSSLDFRVLREMAPQVPTLREAMEVIPRHVFVNVEIKNIPGDAGFDEERSIVDETIDELRAYDEPTRILLSSFDPMSMQRAGDVGPEFLRGQLVRTPVPLDIGLSFAREFKMDAINPQYTLLRDNTTELMAQIREANLRTVVWDVNSAEEIEAIAAAGADAIITNDPRMARAVLDQP